MGGSVGLKAVYLCGVIVGVNGGLKSHAGGMDVVKEVK